jgi:hypothetical protein
MYQPSGGKRLTAYKSGYLDALRGGAQKTKLGKRKQRKYENGYCTGIYWGTLRRLESIS